MGAIQGIFAAQYEVLRKKGHTPSEAFNETVEELTQSLMPWSPRTEWTGCMPTAPLRAKAPWTGGKDSATLPCRIHRIYESVAAERITTFHRLQRPGRLPEKLDAELKELRRVNYGRQARQ